jgi:MFS family permease
VLALWLPLVANALWESSLGALKTFVFLFITVGLGHSQAASAGIVGGVALLILPAAVLSGKLADRYGRPRSSSRSCSSWASAAASS